jgi:hypothetical protein
VATVRSVLWKHKPDGRGHLPTWLRFDDGARTLYHSIRVKIHPRHWTPRAERGRKSHDLHEDINGLIEGRLADAERERLRLLQIREVSTAEALKSAVAGKGYTDCFLDFAHAHLDDVEAQGNVGRVREERADSSAPSTRLLPRCSGEGSRVRGVDRPAPLAVRGGARRSRTSGWVRSRALLGLGGRPARWRRRRSAAGPAVWWPPGPPAPAPATMTGPHPGLTEAARDDLDRIVDEREGAGIPQSARVL